MRKRIDGRNRPVNARLNSSLPNSIALLPFLSHAVSAFADRILQTSPEIVTTRLLLFKCRASY